jgi:hypothetical protein
MLPPDDARIFLSGISIHQQGGTCVPSAALSQLFTTARSGYDWPAGMGASVSQQRIISLEISTSGLTAALNATNAHRIVSDVSSWAGNNSRSHNRILSATALERRTMYSAIASLLTVGNEEAGIDALCSLPGMRLVIATKVFRFCCPRSGAAVDRHASYFFNSLPVVGGGPATRFVRQWSNGRRSASRLAIYSSSRYAQNKREYFEAYLPLLVRLACELNWPHGKIRA